MRLLLPFGLILLIDWFALQAVEGILPNGISTAFGVAYWTVPVLVLILTVAFAGGFSARWPRPAVIIPATLLMILYLSKLMMAMVILADDGRRMIAWILDNVLPAADLSTDRSVFMQHFGVGLGLVPLLSLTYGLIWNPYRYKMRRATIDLPDLPPELDGLRIVHLSDIHAGSFLFRGPVRRSVKMVNALDPDLVCFTGDLVNNRAEEMDGYVDIFGAIRARYGVYSVLGNHDYGDYCPWPDRQSKEANHNRLKATHAQMGWRLLCNTHAMISKGHARIAIIGSENFSSHRRFHSYGDMQRATAGMPAADLQILLSHDPSHWDAEIIQQYPNIHITLSGHTHGFQFGIEIPGIFRWSPVQYVYRRWAGLYREGMQYLYINRGLGVLGYPGRVGILPEITLLTIRRR